MTDIATVDAPAPSAPASAPSETSAAPSVSSSKPASMQEAFAQTAAKRAADPGTAPATVAPVGTEGVHAKPKGPIPFDVHETTLKNAREKTRAEVEQQYGWAKGLNRDEIAQVQAFRQAYATDPVGTLQRELAALAEHPQYGPQLRSLAAKQLAGGRSAAPAADLKPIQIQLEDGRTISVLPADQLSTFEQQVLAKAKEQFAPAMQAAQKLEQAEGFARAQHQAQQYAGGFYQELSSLPHFKELQADIKQALATTRLASDHPAEVSRAAYAIYTRLFAEKVLPTMAQQNQAQTLASLKSKAVALTESPSGAATAPTSRPTTPQALAKWMEQRAAQRGG